MHYVRTHWSFKHTRGRAQSYELADDDERRHRVVSQTFCTYIFLHTRRNTLHTEPK